MPLGPAQRARYARHLLLPELGEAGQLKLLAARVRPAEGADGEAWEVAREYLARAGVEEDAAEGTPIALPNAAELAALAGEPELVEAARALAGAFCAVEAIKSLAGLGVPAALPAAFSLSSEDA